MRRPALGGTMRLLCAVVPVVAALRVANAADIATRDGLVLRLDDKTGAVQAVIVNGQPLPGIEGVRGGLSYRELKPVVMHEPKAVAKASFEEGDASWMPTANANWEEGQEVAAARKADGGADGSQGYVRLGEKQRYGHGVGLKGGVAARGGGLYEISWAARVPSKAATYILYVRLLDEAGRDITEATPPPPHWQYSPYSKTHYQYLIEAQTPNAWETIRRTYLVPDGVARIQVALCLWRGDYVEADSLCVAEVGQGGWEKVVTPEGQLTCDAQGTWQQIIALPEKGLKIALRYPPRKDHVLVEGEVSDTHTPPAERALRVCYSLPIRAEGWWWHDDVRTRRRIEGKGVFRNVNPVAGHEYSLYPFSVICNEAVGVALGAPLDWPRIEKREYSLEKGFQACLDLGLSPLTAKIGLGKATFAFVLYRTDAEWGFRSAAAGYYAIFPQFFVKRAEREGCWLFPVRPSEIPNPEDFGLTFWEGFSPKPEERENAHKHGIYVFPYTESWGLRQPLPGVANREDAPPPEKLLATLQQWAAERTSNEQWGFLGGPRWETAQALLNSLPRQADGTSPASMDHYGAWAQWWRTNPDPDLPAPSRWSVCKKYNLDPVVPHADGIYLDSVTVWLGTYENYREEHLACSDLPLTFGMETGRPCLLGIMSQYEFMAWIADYLHPQQKLVQMNVFEGALRFYAHLGDVLGSEVGDLIDGKRQLDRVETDAASSLRRVYAYRKPTTNLLQAGSYETPRPAVTHEEIEHYLNHQTFYGFYPGVATGGGEEKPGYKDWKRYFRSPEQFERDRDLFKKYIPIIRRINAAGWEPIPWAWTSDEGVMIERFGSWEKGDLCFTLRNGTEQEKVCSVRVRLTAIGGGREDAGRARATELLSDSPVATKPGRAEGEVCFDLALPPMRTAVVSVSK